jgi:rubredoxin
MPAPIDVTAFVEDTVETDTHVKLPLGLFHRESGRWFKYADIREMTGRDEEAMSDPHTKKNGGKILTMLLASCTTHIGPFPVTQEIMRSLTFGDRDLLLMKIRQLGFGNEVKFDCVCPKCEAKIVVKADLSHVDILHGEETPALDFKVTLVKGIQFQGETYKDAVVTFPTGADMEFLGQKELRDNEGKANTAMLTRNIKSVGALTDLSPAIIQDMASVDRRLLNDAIMERMPRPDFGVTVLCSMCDHEFKEALSPVNFFSPK